MAQELSTHSTAPWAEITLYVWNRKVQFQEPETGRVRGVVDGQYAMLPIKSVMEDVRKEAELLRQRQPDQIGKVEKHRYVSHQAAVISGTRIRVATIQHFVEAGYSTADILKEYPSLTEADIETAKRHGKDGLAA